MTVEAVDRLQRVHCNSGYVHDLSCRIYSGDQYHGGVREVRYGEITQPEDAAVLARAWVEILHTPVRVADLPNWLENLPWRMRSKFHRRAEGTEWSTDWCAVMTAQGLPLDQLTEVQRQTLLFRAKGLTYVQTDDQLDRSGSSRRCQKAFDTLRNLLKTAPQPSP